MLKCLAFIIDYIGHGSEVGWSDEHVLEISDIVNWRNINKLPMFMTATCEFSRYDNPGMKSAGEIMFLSPNGGAIALITTTRLAFSTYNQYVNKRFISNVYKRIDGEHYTIGDIYRLSKTPQIPNSRNITLFGDPALTLSDPEYKISTTTTGNSSLKKHEPISKSGFVPNQSSYRITLKVFDVLGREVAMLVNDYQSSGNYKVSFDASGLSSGIYFYTLRAGQYIDTKKMLLLR